MAVSSIYENISFSELCKLLPIDCKIDPIRVEKIVAGLISEGKLTSTIDQTTSRIYFNAKDEDVFRSRLAEKIKVICQELVNFESMVEAE